MNIEIEIKSDNAKNEIYDLRNFIQNAENNDLQVKIKEQPANEGEMSILGTIGLFINY